MLRILAIGDTLPFEEATLALVGAGLLLIVGLWPSRTERAGWLGVVSTGIYLLLPLVLIFAFDLYKPAWIKFLAVVLPCFHILVAHGVENLAHFVVGYCRPGIGRFRISNLRSLLSVSVLVLVSVATFPSLRNLYFDPAYSREDYRQIAADIVETVRSGDAVILNAPNQWEVFTYYYPDRDVHPAPYRPGLAGAEAAGRTGAPRASSAAAAKTSTLAPMATQMVR